MKRAGADPWRLEFMVRGETTERAKRARNPEANSCGSGKASHALARVPGDPESFILSDKETRVRIENRVYTTYLGDMRTQTRCGLPLNEIRRLMTRFPHLSVEKRGQILVFAFREPLLITHVLAETGVILENGARNSSGGTAVIRRFVDTLRGAGFENIGILKRTCVNVQGIVNYPFQIALHYFCVDHKTHARYNDNPRSVFFYCHESIGESDIADHGQCVFEIYQNGTVKCMGASNVAAVAMYFEYLTAEIAKYKLDATTQKLEDFFRLEHEKEHTSTSRRRAKRRGGTADDETLSGNDSLPYLPPPMLRMAHDAAPSLLADLVTENEPRARQASPGEPKETRTSTKSTVSTSGNAEAAAPTEQSQASTPLRKNKKSRVTPQKKRPKPRKRTERKTRKTPPPKDTNAKEEKASAEEEVMIGSLLYGSEIWNATVLL